MRFSAKDARAKNKAQSSAFENARRSLTQKTPNIVYQMVYSPQKTIKKENGLASERNRFDLPPAPTEQRKRLDGVVPPH